MAGPSTVNFKRATLSHRTPLWKSFLAGWILLIIVLCSFPWLVEPPQWGRVKWVPLLDLVRSPHRLVRDTIANFVLYLPLGFSYSKVRWSSGVTLIEAAVIGLCVSLSCELYQVFSPVRFPTMTDVLMNTMGALAGASIAARHSTIRNR